VVGLLKAAYGEAQAHYESNRWPDAIAIYRQIVAGSPREMRAWALMGLCATQMGDLVGASEALQRASELEPQAANIFFRLGIVLYQRGLATEAEAAFRRVVDLDPTNLDAHQNLAATLVDQGRHAEAQPIFEGLVARQPNFELAWAGLANVHRALGDSAGMIHALERAVAINPANTATRHLLTAARGQTPAHPDWAYVEEFFDGYAARFETHLVSRLEYRAPETLCAQIYQSFPDRSRFARVLDLGCGTGLFGAAIRGIYAGDILIGVDLSQRMVEATVARDLYSAVEKNEAGAYLSQTTQRFDLIAATDVFIYIGDVSSIFAGAARCLVAGGVLAFTLEPSVNEGFVLETSGRYAHNPRYIHDLAAKNNFRVLTQHTAPLRRDGPHNEEGLYVVLVRAEDVVLERAG
jgi:predicted TPR repeat methyltransferase